MGITFAIIKMHDYSIQPNKTMINSERSRLPEQERLLSDNLQFALAFAVEAGHYMVTERANLTVSKKLDGTDVSDVDLVVNARFEEAVELLSNGRASVIGEESSRRGTGDEEIWVIDPVDGTAEYVNDAIADEARTSCVGIALLKNGEAQLSVVYNPFKDELFYAERDFGNGAYLNGSRLDLDQINMGQSGLERGLPYDYCHWENAPVDARFFEGMLGCPPLDSGSAIYQACMVAKGESAFAIFPGNTIHDIIPAAFLVEAAGGVVSNVNGGHLSEGLDGAIYAVNSRVHAGAVSALAAMRS